MQQFASIISTLTLSGTATLTVDGVSGAPCMVFGLLVRNGSGSVQDVTIATAETVPVTIMVISAADNVSLPINIPFVANKGLTISTSTPHADAQVTVFHSHAGA